MPIEFHCQNCSRPMRTPDSAAGKKGKCPHCGAMMDIPSSSPQQASVPAGGTGDSHAGPTGQKAQAGQGDRIEFPCPQCSLPVRTPASAAGKKGKCPNCGEVVQIPAKASGESEPEEKPTGKIQFRCPGCQKMLRTPVDLAGKKIKCPSCKAVLSIPTAEQQQDGAVPVLEEPGSSPVDDAPGLAPLDETPGLAPLDETPGLMPVDETPGLSPLDGGPALTPVEEIPTLEPLDGGTGLAPLEPYPSLVPVQCPSCGANYQVKGDMVGKCVMCGCGNSVYVPPAQQPVQNPGVGLDPLGMEGYPMGAPQQQQWGAPQQAPAQFQQPLQPISSSGTYLGAAAKPKGSVDAIAILEIVVSSLCLVQGAILGILHLIRFFDVLDFLTVVHALVTIREIFSLLAGLASLCMVAFAICLLIDAIGRVAGGRSKMDWSPNALLTSCIAYVGARTVGLLIVIIIIVSDIRPMFGNWDRLVVKAILYWLLVSLVPVFHMVVFGIRVKKS